MNISEGVPERTPFLFYTTLPPISIPERTVELSGIFLPVINVRNSRLISGKAGDSAAISRLFDGCRMTITQRTMIACKSFIFHVSALKFCFMPVKDILNIRDCSVC